MKLGIKNYFENFFKESNILRPFLDGLSFKKLFCADNRSIEESFSEEEIKIAVWSCDREKSAGPDKYTLDFYKKNWEVVQEDILYVVRGSYVSAKLVKAVTTSFLALIPKVPNP